MGLLFRFELWMLFWWLLTSSWWCRGGGWSWWRGTPAARGCGWSGPPGGVEVREDRGGEVKGKLNGMFKSMRHLNAATPLVHQPIQADLKQLVLPEGPMGHHHPVVELIERSLPLRRPVVVQELDEAAVALMEPRFMSYRNAGNF